MYFLFLSTDSGGNVSKHYQTCFLLYMADLRAEQETVQWNTALATQAQ